jgi:hypothetical protein
MNRTKRISNSLIVMDQENKLMDYIRSKINGNPLFKFSFFCINKHKEGSQIHICFSKKYDSLLYEMIVTNIEKYLVKADKIIEFSPVGDISNIIYTLITDILKQHTPIKEKLEIYIIMNSNLVILPEIKNGFLYIIDKTERGIIVSNDCPICLTSMNSLGIEQLTLPCYHKVCRDCFFGSVNSGLISCPICRKDIFNNVNLDNH